MNSTSNHRKFYHHLQLKWGKYLLITPILQSPPNVMRESEDVNKKMINEKKKMVVQSLMNLKTEDRNIQEVEEEGDDGSVPTQTNMNWKEEEEEDKSLLTAQTHKKKNKDS